MFGHGCSGGGSDLLSYHQSVQPPIRSVWYLCAEHGNNGRTTKDVFSSGRSEGVLIRMTKIVQPGAGAGWAALLVGYRPTD